jgi:hypothetical protein
MAGISETAVSIYDPDADLRVMSPDQARMAASHWRWQSADLEQRLSATRAELAEARVSKGWQPIETVPKDETEVLMTDGKRRWVGWTDGEFWSVETTWPISEDSNREATHWMPLPPPPVTESTSEGLGHE